MRRAFLAALCCVLLLSGQALAGAAFYQPGPQGSIGVSRPRLGMRVQTTDGDQVTQATVTVDGQSFPAGADGDLYYYQPAAPLTPGAHRVNIHLVLSGNYQPLDRTWQVIVAPGALAELPGANANQLAVLDAVNRYRRLADLGPVALDPALDAAATAHARYFILNPSSGLSVHYERPGEVGFTGQAPWDRGAYFGFQSAGAYEEDMHFTADHQKAVRDWVDSVYHRFLITDPDLSLIGYGFAGDGSDTYANVLEGAAPPGDSGGDAVLVVAYPMPGQREVPVTWDDHEAPDPLRLWNTKNSGYPITLQFSAGVGLTGVKVSGAGLTDADGVSVPLWVNTPDNDEHLKSQVALLPRVDLKAGTRYTASVAGTVYLQDGTSKPFTKAWWFTTAGAGDGLTANPGISVRLNGVPMRFEVAPALENNRTMVPFRAIFEALGANVNWDATHYAVLARSVLHSIRLKIGNDRALVDSQDVLLDAPPLIVGDRTLVPLRFVAENLGLKVDWDEKTRTVSLVGP